MERNEEALSAWVMNKLKHFGPFLRLSFEGFEEEMVELFRRIEKNSKEVKGEDPIEDVQEKGLRSKLNKLESSVNYDRREGTRNVEGSNKGKGIVLCV